MNLMASTGIGPVNRPGMADDDSLIERLEKLQSYLGCETQRDMALKLKIGTTTLNNYFKGYRPPIDAAMKIQRAVPGLTLDWLYHGDPGKLPVDLASALGELPAGNAGPSTATKAGRRGSGAQ